MKVPPWSYSSLTKFETCPKQYYHVRVAKDVIEQQGEAALWGSTVHKYLEDRARHGTALPEYVAHYEPLVAPVISQPGTLLVEQQFALDEKLKPVTWTSDTAWCRGIVDVGIVNDNKAVLLDWKTGKRELDSDQLKLFAAMAFAHYPRVDVVYTGFVWLKDGKLDKEKFTKDDTPGIWRKFIPRVRRLHIAYAEDLFPPKPSGLCAKWCPVPKSKCSFSGKT